MKYAGEQILRVKQHVLDDSGSSTVPEVGRINTGTTGIPDAHYLNYLNDAQDRLQALIVDAHLRVFETQTTIALSATTRNYDVPTDAFSKNRVLLVEYASTSQTDDFRPIRKVSFRELSTAEIDHPTKYAIVNGDVYISPTPSSGTGSIRITYTRRLDRLDLRRGKVGSVTGTGTTGDPITQITISTTADDVTTIDEAVLVNRYLCVNDADGVVNAYNIPFTAYDDATGIFTVTNHVLGTGETVSANDYITIGKYTTTHSKLEDFTERYLIKYVVSEVLSMEDSSNDGRAAQAVVGVMERDIVDAYEPDGEDYNSIPIVNNYFRL